MPYPNEHAARIKSPALFEKESFRRKSIQSGISLILGKLKRQSSMTAQAYRFSKSTFSADEAKKWLKDHDIKYISFEAAIQSFQENVFLNCIKIQAFSNNEILEMIPPDTLVDIKLQDKHPYFQVYSLCHEGISNPKLLGQTKQRPILWTRKAIQSIKNIVLKGIKLFKGHNKDNSVENREAFGEVIHDFQKEIKGKLHHLVVTYHKPEHKNIAKDLNIISQEGIWNFLESAKGIIADSVETITGIAGGNSEYQMPAFSEAKRLGFVQAFEGPKDKGANMSDYQAKKLSFKEWVNMKDEFRVIPNQLFTIEDLKTDKEFGKIFEQLDNLVKENDTLKKKHEKEIEKFNTEILSYKKQASSLTAKQRLNDIITNEKISDNIKLYIEKVFEDSKNNMNDFSDDELKSFVQKETKTYQYVMSLKDDNKTDNPPILKEETQEKNEFLEEEIDFEKLLY